MVKRINGAIYSQEELDAMWARYDFALKQELFVASERLSARTPHEKGRMTMLIKKYQNEARVLRHAMSSFGQRGLEFCVTTNVEWEPKKRIAPVSPNAFVMSTYHFHGEYLKNYIAELHPQNMYGIATKRAATMQANKPSLTLSYDKMVLATPVAEFLVGHEQQTRAVFFSGLNSGFAMVEKKLLNEILFDFHQEFGDSNYTFYTHTECKRQTIALFHEETFFAVCMILYNTEHNLAKLYEAYVLALQLENGDTSHYSESRTELTPVI